MKTVNNTVIFTLLAGAALFPVSNAAQVNSTTDSGKPAARYFWDQAYVWGHIER